MRPHCREPLRPNHTAHLQACTAFALSVLHAEGEKHDTSIASKKIPTISQQIGNTNVWYLVPKFKAAFPNTTIVSTLCLKRPTSLGARLVPISSGLHQQLGRPSRWKCHRFRIRHARRLPLVTLQSHVHSTEVNGYTCASRCYHRARNMAPGDFPCVHAVRASPYFPDDTAHSKSPTTMTLFTARMFFDNSIGCAKMESVSDSD
jgi:hypothetical protein